MIGLRRIGCEDEEEMKFFTGFEGIPTKRLVSMIVLSNEAQQHRIECLKREVKKLRGFNYYLGRLGLFKG